MHLQPAGHEPDLLTIAEAAQLLHAPVATLGIGGTATPPRSFRLGRRVLYRRDDLLGWIDAQREDSVPTEA